MKIQCEWKKYFSDIYQKMTLKKDYQNYLRFYQ